MKRWTLIGGGALAALVLAFLGGRYSVRPSKTTETAAAAKQAETHTDAKIETDTDTKQTVHRTITRRTAPALPPSLPVAGVCPPCPAVQVEEISEDIGTNIDQDQHADLHIDGKTAETSATTKTTEVGERPGWAFGVSALWDPSHPSSKPERVTLELDRRLLGTLWLGARLSSETDLTAWRVGAAARVEW